MEDCCKRKKSRSPDEYKKLIHRLNRVEGQLRGIKSMVENSAYCPDILIQVAAVQAALSGFARELTGQHIRDCVVTDIREGRLETADELTEVIKKLIR